jgi:hypothetical protein
MKVFVYVMVLLLAGSLPGLAEYYKYRDENGVLRFSDTLPEKYADQVKIYQDSVSSPSPVEKIRQPVKAVAAPPKKQRTKAAPQQVETQFALLKNRILLPVEIVGTRGRATVNLVMDTGAQRTFLWRNALPSIGLRRVGRVRASGITGSKYASTVRAKSVNVGPYRLKGVEIAVMSTGRYHKNYDGLLGMDFLVQARYEIDHKRQVIIWKGLN